MSVSSRAFARAPSKSSFTSSFTSRILRRGGGRSHEHAKRSASKRFCRRDATTFLASSSSSSETDRQLLDKMKVAVASATSAPTAKHVLEALKELSSQEFGLANVKFTEVMAKIDELYDHDPQFGYSSGVGTDGFETENKAGVNMGSNKVFYFAKMHDFTEEMTLRLFCEHYQDVLDTPDGQSHLNIRSFMKNGWAGVRFEGETLRPKGKEGEGERIDQI
ncbi:HopJ type III effector protein [Bathycoccus prasinos]|uniref:HopJ type III effector protein n=1 Tax=Bathycoccus prasinos TaxID=41875 RepID=K8EH98_9CHLO|nr:HopJ type III effector protein [Bathycoccus prasinos]CCO17369.1 HopJ type III effector protein [Bathycoccus prasinos]|eukprot:XP_007512769.1 HopJ type III effector protein [Bathycoccus prasinos]